MLSLGLMEALCFMGVFSLCVTGIKNRQTFYHVPGWPALLCLQSYIIFQVIPLPGDLVRVISPAAYDIYNQSAGVVGSLDFMPLSIDIKSTVRELFRFSACICLYILTIQILASGRRLKKTLLVLAFLGAGIGVYALIERFFSNGKIYWLFTIPEGNTHIGPYVYKNHYAGFVEMIFPLVLALFFYYKPMFSYNSFKESVIEVFTLPKANRHILLGFSALILGTSQFISLSRGGVVCLSLSSMVFVLMIRQGKKMNHNGVSALFFVFLLLLSVSWFGWDALVSRFGEVLSQDTINLNGRMIFWNDSLNIIRDFPLFGSGFGTFGSIYPAFRTFPGDSIVDHAHNDYVELAVTGGVIGIALVLWFWIALFVHVFKALGKRKDVYAIYLFWGAFSGILAILLHSVSDFNFYSGANALYVFFMAGLLVSAVNTRFHLKGTTRLDPVGKRAMCLMIPALLVLFSGSLWFNGGGLLGAYRFMDVENRELTGRMPEEDLRYILAAALSAVGADPLEARYHMACALAYDYSGRDKDAMDSYGKALALAPAQGDIVQRVGRSFFYKGELETAARLMEAGLLLGKSDVEYYKHFGAVLLHSGDIKKGQATLKRALEINGDSKNINDCIAIMVDSGLSPDDMITGLPERLKPRYALADYLLKKGDLVRASKIENDALAYIGHEEKVFAWMFSRIYKKKIEQNDNQGALDMINLGLTYLPDNTQLRIQAGKMYERLGIPYRAIEEYRKALTTEPGNRQAQRLISALAKKNDQ